LICFFVSVAKLQFFSDITKDFVGFLTIFPVNPDRIKIERHTSFGNFIERENIKLQAVKIPNWRLKKGAVQHHATRHLYCVTFYLKGAFGS